MNGRQAAREAAKHIEELENFNQRSAADNRAYVQTIHSMIEGTTPCAMCEEERLGECEHPDCHMKQGCQDWWLRTDIFEQEQQNGGGENNGDDCEGILSASHVS